MVPVRFFLLKGNESKLDHCKSVNELGCYWSKGCNKHLHIGDICYLFLSGIGHNVVRYKLEVVDTDARRGDEVCWKAASFVPGQHCYKLEPVGEFYAGDELSREKLEEIGISKYVVFKKLSSDQVDYIDKFFE